MKFLKINLLIITVVFFQQITVAQDINWAALKEKQRHIVNLNTGLLNGLVFSAGYGYKLKTKLPVILNAEYSFPSGSNLLDDFKTKIGGQIRLYEVNDFQFSAKVQGVFRRYQNASVRMVNFGSDLSGVIGYYKPKWFVAGEFGFDKAIVTEFKHSESYRQTYPDVKDGWYQPATGGNAYYGIQTGYSFNSSDLYLKAGQQLSQDFKTKSAVPYYLQVGFNKKF
jgi:hypothetical protein